MMWWLVLGLPALAMAYLVLYQRWEHRVCSGNAYFGAPLARRRRLRRWIKFHGSILRPLVAGLCGLLPGSRKIQFQRINDIAVPLGVCDAASLATALAYQPQAEDIFVVTPMKCGTTWMQQIVYQLLTAGRGDFDGQGHLQAMSPWLEAISGVALQDAPVVGGNGARIIKSHLPAQLCPRSDTARYIYVARDPVRCFASVRDYMQMLYGPFCPADNVLRDWYLGEDMFFGPWKNHVQGWRERADQSDNTLLLWYEDMLADPAQAIAQVAGFLGIELTDAGRRQVEQKSSFEYMQGREEFFAMNPPNLFTETSPLRFLGNRAQKRAVSAADAAVIHAACGDTGR